VGSHEDTGSNTPADNEDGRMNKRKCRNRECNKFFRPDKTEEYIKAFWCSPECKEAIAIAHYRKNQANKLKARSKAEKKAKQQADREHRERKKDLKPISHWLNETQKVFNRWIVLRDAEFPCISSGRWDVNAWHAGHWRTVGAASHLRFNEDNVHKQSDEQNIYQSGNVSEYRINLVHKIGLERVQALENDNKPRSWTREELEEKRVKYRSKIKELESQV